MRYPFSPPPVVSVPILGSDRSFPVHRIYCVGRNYADHAREMGATAGEPPVFFLKPADAALAVAAGACGDSDRGLSPEELLFPVGIDPGNHYIIML